MESFRISACVVLYKQTEMQLTKLFQSVKNSLVNTNFVVIDNSDDNCLEKFVLSYGFFYRHNPTNPGFGTAHNLGFSLIEDSSFHFILNPDVYFDPNVISGLVDYLKRNPEIVLVSPKILYPDGSLQRLCKTLPSPLNLFARRFFSPLGRYLDYNFELQWFDYASEAEIPYLSGCFMAIRSSAFSRVGGFDERFFMYLEDTDLCRRLLKLGRLVFNPQYTVFHVFEKASYRNPRLLKAHIESAIYYFKKWGWLFDSERRQINAKTIAALRQILLKRG